MASDTDTTSLPPTTAPTDASASTACAADEPRRRRLDHVDSTVAPGLSPLVSGAEVACRADEAVARSVDECCRRALHHFPSPGLDFSMPALEFDLRVAVALSPHPSHVDVSVDKELVTVSAGQWSGSFGNGPVVTGGYDLGQARGFRPVRIVQGAFVMQTTDEPPAVLELRTRGTLSGPCDVLDTLLSPRQPKDVDARRYGFRMFATVKSADKRYAEIVNCGLWVASGVWSGDELIIDAYRVS